MEKFSKEFYASRIEEWITKYIKLKELRRLIKSIENDIKKNGGEIIHMSERKSELTFEDVRPSRPSRLTQLDRHTVGLSVLENTDGLFNKNEKIFNTPTMYEINETFKEIENLDYCDDIKIFLYFLSIEVHNVYVFYLSIEKDIFNRVNGHLYSRKKYEKMSKNELLEELVDLTDITYLIYTFYNYIDLNILAISEILKYFDDHFQILNDDISLHKLFFKKNLSKKDSDLKYILSFKIIIEGSALIESYYQEIQKIDNSKEIKAQIRELKEVLSYLNEKNTDRVNDEIYEVYCKQKQEQYYSIIKQKKNINIDIQNSFLIDVHQQENYYKRLGEKQYDKEINIGITKKNMNNLLLLYIHTFIYSLFYIIPYLSFYFYFVENSIEFYYLGFVLTSTHLGNLISKIFINFCEKYKFLFLVHCFIFMCSFAITVFSEIFIDKNYLTFYVIANIIARFLYGYSCVRVITRKYIMLYIPESEIKYYSLIYIIITYFGLLCGVILNILVNDKEPSITISINTSISFEFEIHIFLFCIGFFLSFFYLFIILCVFTEPTNGSMLSQKRNTISTKDDSNRDSENNNIYEYKDDAESNSEEKSEKNEKLIEFVKKCSKTEEENERKISDILSSNNSDEIEYKSYNDNNNRLRINTVNSYENNKDEIITNNINLLNKKMDLKENNIMDENNEIKNKKSFKDELMSAEEIKGLNSLEKNLIHMNTNNNYNDMNLLPNELNRIKKNQFLNNRSYISPFFVIFISLLLTNILNEYILLSMPLCFLTLRGNFYEMSENETTISITILLIFSFPIVIFIRMMKTFYNERRLLRIFYIVLCFTCIGFSFLKYLVYDSFGERKSTNYSFKKFSYVFILLIIIILSNLVEGTTNLLSYKIIPSFVKICHINNKYIISYTTVFGKIIGGILYIVLIIMDESEKENKEFVEMNIFKYSSYIICTLTIISFLILCLCYNSLRVRAISKLFYIND